MRILCETKEGRITGLENKAVAAIAVTLDPNGDPEILKTSCKSLCVLTSSVVAANKASLSEMAAQIGSVTEEFRTLVDIATNNPRKTIWVPALMTLANLSYRY